MHQLQPSNNVRTKGALQQKTSAVRLMYGYGMTNLGSWVDSRTDGTQEMDWVVFRQSMPHQVEAVVP
jgi:hypothetical protein